MLITVGMKAEVESEERGPQRNSADLRIKKAQVSRIALPLQLRSV